MIKVITKLNQKKTVSATNIPMTYGKLTVRSALHLISSFIQYCWSWSTPRSGFTSPCCLSKWSLLYLRVTCFPNDRNAASWRKTHPSCPGVIASHLWSVCLTRTYTRRNRSSLQNFAGRGYRRIPGRIRGSNISTHPKLHSPSNGREAHCIVVGLIRSWNAGACTKSYAAWNANSLCLLFRKEDSIDDTENPFQKRNAVAFVRLWYTVSRHFLVYFLRGVQKFVKSARRISSVCKINYTLEL